MSRIVETEVKDPKKMVIYEIIKDHPIPSKRVMIPLRSITVHPTFCGIREKGMINFQDFKDLARALEPKADKIFVQVMSL